VSRIKIEAVGGCDDDGMCISSRAGYTYEIGGRVFILLKKRSDRNYYQSTQGGLTAYLVTDDGRIYKYKESLELIGGNGFDSKMKPRPKTFTQIKSLWNL